MKPIEITRIFGHLDRDPMAVADVMARTLTPLEMEALIVKATAWTAGLRDAVQARVEAGRDLEVS